jgi:hypothetical protein
MEEKECLMLEKYVNLSKYPLHEPNGRAWRDAVENIRSDLASGGSSVLRHFIRDDIIDRLQTEGEAIASKAYYKPETVNAYNLPLNAPLPDDHPAKIVMQRGNAFVARDLVPDDHVIHQLYNSKAVLKFIAACFELDDLHRLADPLAGLCLNVLRPGCSHPWHFDINEFTVSMLTKKPDAGGMFDYCPNIRSPENENSNAVRDVLTGHGEQLVQHLELQPGDLQMFKGRYALHQVSPVEGETERHTAIFAYTPTPGVIGTAERTKQLFGRALPAHEAAEQNKIRADGLLD